MVRKDEWPGMANGQEWRTVRNVHAKHDQRPEMFIKSRSRFENERIIVV
jgi:hypothetical protein